VKEVPKPILIKDLLNLKNQYLDPISYLKLIAVNPKEFNPKLILSLISNYEKQVPINTFLKAYELAKEYTGRWTDMEIYASKSKIDPLYIMSIILRKISLEGETVTSVDDTAPREQIYSEVENKIQEIEESLIEHMRETADNISKYTSDILVINQIKEMNDLYDTGDPKYEKYGTENIFFVAWEKLKNTDPKVYDTSDWHTYSDKLIPIFLKLICKTKIVI